MEVSKLEFPQIDFTGMEYFRVGERIRAKKAGFRVSEFRRRKKTNKNLIGCKMKGKRRFEIPQSVRIVFNPFSPCLSFHAPFFVCVSLDLPTPTYHPLKGVRYDFST